MSIQAAATFKEKCCKMRGVVVITGICLFGLSFPAYPQTKSSKTSQKEKTMKTHASGTFEVKVIPQAADETAGDAAISRYLLDKQFHGDLEATSKGQMLAAGLPADGSGGYVAMEKVSGALNGRKGSFALQHNGTMKGGAAEMNVIVVPGSGTDQLAGLEGKMTIIIADGKHSYEFEYALAEAK